MITEQVFQQFLKFTEWEIIIFYLFEHVKLKNCLKSLLPEIWVNA